MIKKYDRDNFTFYVSLLVENTHFVHRNLFLSDTLSVQSEEYKIIHAKPERYSILLENKFDYIFSYRRNLLPSRLVMLRDSEEFNENGIFYEELDMICESLDFVIDRVSLDKSGIQEYFKRIKNREILNATGHKLREPIAVPKVYFDGEQFTEKKVERAFQDWCICPYCSAEVDQKEIGKKIDYQCKNSDCDFKVAIDKSTIRSRSAQKFLDSLFAPASR